VEMVVFQLHEFGAPVEMVVFGCALINNVNNQPNGPMEAMVLFSCYFEPSLTDG
jgi:hypothetical protein